MRKILPSLYKGKVTSTSKNQKQVILNKTDDNHNEDLEEKSTGKSVNKQIKDIFNSPGYVYKANVSITMNDGEIIKKTIIGRTNNSLITMDDELIDVNKITQIDFLD